MDEISKRVNGWKSIGAYFGRDRTTAIRWARERNLPVRRTPGGKVSSVYAFTHELQQWLENSENAGPAPGVAAAPARRLGWQLGVWGAACIAALALLLALILPREATLPTTRPTPGELLPRDSETAALYLQARRNWARRQSKSINDAIAGFGAVISRDPSYAPAYAGLADAYILAREFGSLPDGIAFPRAKSAAIVALKLAPNLAGARRALGFVQYWSEHDVEAAGVSFRQALKAAPADAQTHYWYSTALTDNGDFAAAMRELDVARMMNPESAPIQADWAFLLWATGKRDAAEQILSKLAKEDPRFAEPHDCLRYIYLADRNFPRYLDEMAALAELRGEPVLITQILEERTALAQGGVSRLKAMMLRHAIEDRARQIADRVWPASIASAIGDRMALLTLLRDADRRGEKWGSASQRVQIARTWSNDGEISQLLARRAPPPMEQ